jgi:hypothetical protein
MIFCVVAAGFSPMPHSFCEAMCFCGRFQKRINTNHARPAALECGGMTPLFRLTGLQGHRLESQILPCRHFSVSRRFKAAASCRTPRRPAQRAMRIRRFACRPQNPRFAKNYAALGFSPRIGTPQSLIFMRLGARHAHEHEGLLENWAFSAEFIVALRRRSAIAFSSASCPRGRSRCRIRRL